MQAITNLARKEGLGPDDIEQAARAYRVGVLENPWMDEGLRERIVQAEQVITSGRVPRADGGDGAKGEERPANEAELFPYPVLGQPAAVRKSVDILMRSALNLTAAHTSGNKQRPRGVLFFAGPTGVGKTQLAKAINHMVFDSDTPIVFDMSEFSEEHAQARLLGAPPGYVGYGTGGELTSAIRQRPFSVVLFDEIEKANTVILDKFLQILDEGRITDGMGQTAVFSEAIIIFTSNMGMLVPETDANGQPVRDTKGNVRMVPRANNDDYAQLEKDVVADIKRAFTEQIGRPELLNRIGQDNIVVFDFVQRDVGLRIFEMSVENVRRRVKEQCGVDLRLAPEMQTTLSEFALKRLDMGGRGVETAVETSLVNPLARALFDVPLGEGRTVEITGGKEESNLWTLDVEVRS